MKEERALLEGSFQEEWIAELNSIMRESPAPFYHMMRYHLGWADEKGATPLRTIGKGLRPNLCLLACQAVGGDCRVALPAAAALELIHNFSLIHDDIEDRSPERRHRPTVWRVWGDAQAINTGDGMYALAYLALLRLRERGVSPEKVWQTVYLCSETCLSLCEGQYLDISFEERLDITIEEYLEMIRRKTAALFSCSAQLGAVLGTDDERVIRAFAVFGEKLGLGFQIYDDMVGIWGRVEEIGKSPMTDIMGKKKTLPILHVLNKGSAHQKEPLLEVYRKSTLNSEDAAKVMHILKEAGSQSFVMDMAGKCYHSALSVLQSTSLPSASYEALTRYAESLLGSKLKLGNSPKGLDTP